MGAGGRQVLLALLVVLLLGCGSVQEVLGTSVPALRNGELVLQGEVKSVLNTSSLVNDDKQGIQSPSNQVVHNKERGAYSGI